MPLRRKVKGFFHIYDDSKLPPQLLITGLKQEINLTLSRQGWLDLAKSSLLARCPRILRHPEGHPHQGEGARGAWEGQD